MAKVVAAVAAAARVAIAVVMMTVIAAATINSRICLKGDFCVMLVCQILTYA